MLVDTRLCAFALCSCWCASEVDGMDTRMPCTLPLSLGSGSILQRAVTCINQHNDPMHAMRVVHVVHVVDCPGSTCLEAMRAADGKGEFGDRGGSILGMMMRTACY